MHVKFGFFSTQNYGKISLYILDSIILDSAVHVWVCDVQFLIVFEKPYL